MLFSDIIRNLSGIADIQILSNSLDIEITEVRFMDTSTSEFMSNVLYFSNISSGFASLPPQCVITDASAAGALDLSSSNTAVVSEASFGQVFNAAFKLVLDSHKDGYYESMMETLDRVRDVDALIDIASQTFNASLVFIDRDFRILSYSTQIPVTDKLWKHNIEQGYCDYEFITTVRSLKSVQAFDSTMKPVEVSCTSSPFKKFSVKVYCRDIMIGYLIVIEGHDSYRPEHVEMLRILSGVLGYAVMKYQPSYLYMTTDYHRFLYNLIIGADLSVLPEAYRDLTFPSQMQVIYCRATGEQSAFPQEGELSEKLASVIPGCHVLGRRHSAAIIGSKDMLRKAGMILAAFPEECKVKAGVSLLFDDISGLKKYYDEAHDAFEVGCMLDPDLSIYTFEEYGIYVMLRTVASAEDLSRYLHTALPRLEAYDRDNGSNLELTLYTYLRCSCNTTETADALFLHRNSVIYRLRRIEELCEIDLNDIDTRFRLRLSYAVSNMMERTRKWAAR